MDPSLRRSLYTLMLVVATGMMVARVVNAEFVHEPSLYKANPSRKWPEKAPAPWPTFSSNDRSRWATVKALAEDETFVIGDRVPDGSKPKGYHDEGVTFTDGFGSVDKVLHPDRLEFYSTKPPLLTKAAAMEYRLLRSLFGWRIDVEKWEVVVTILLTLNVIPLVIALWLLSRLLECYGTTDWGRLFVFAASCFGTFLPTFAITLNNHVPAACCVVFALHALLAPQCRTSVADITGLPWSPLRDPIRLMQMGLFTGIAACMDFPAAALAAAIGLLVSLESWKWLVCFIPAFLVPIASQTIINYEAVDTWEPVYAKFGGPWYEYPGSHWAKRHDPNPQGIDFIDEPKHVYAFNLLIGHHGLFSLTPLWLLAVVGMFLRFREPLAASRLHRLTPLVAAVVIGFYIVKTNNYGGWSSGPRWLFWLTPMFLLALLPAADRLAASRCGRAIAYICLGASAFSATYPWANPWRHPWIYQWCEYMDWVHY
jgi:hypothetical protein